MRLFHLLWLFILWLKMEKSSQRDAIKCTVPVIENGNVPGDTQEYNEHEVLHFECNPNYIPTDHRPTTCTKQRGRAEWIPTPYCETTKCRLTLPPLEGTIYEPAYRNVFKPGDTVRVICGERYGISNAQNTSATVTCNDDGDWTVRPLCKEVTCSVQRDPLVDNWNVQRLTLNGTARYTCRSGYRSKDGTNLATCTRDGWRPKPLCQEITCEREDIPNANILSPKWRYKNNERANYECKEGYEARPTRICGENGWTGNSQCTVALCQVTGVPDSVHITTYIPNKQLRRGQQLRFACRHHGHFLQGKAMVECLADGQWSAPFPTCGGPLGCNNPPSLTDGDTRESLRGRYSHNERVEYVCQNLYQMEGEPYQTCRNGEWLGRMRCLRPCTVDTEAMSRHNIAFKYKDDNKLYAPHNDHITFTCVRGRHDGRLNMRQSCIDGVMHLPTCH